jgi:HK97 family phage major capsid protein
MNKPKLVHGIDLYAPGGLTALFEHHQAIWGDALMDATVTAARGRLAEIQTRQAAVRSELDTLETSAEDTDENQLRADALLDEWTELDEEAKPLRERAARIAAVRQAMELETATADDGSDTGQTSRAATNAATVTLHSRTKNDPWSKMESLRNGTMMDHEVRSRAVDAIEMYSKRSDHYQMPDEAAENATRMVEKKGRAFGTNIARQMLLTGSPEYLAAFESYLTDPGGYAARAALSLTSANGGYLVPFTLDPTIILTNNSSANPYRQIATIKTTVTNNWNGVTSAGMSAEWTGEGVEAADATPTLGNLQITPQKADAYLFGSFEVLGDSDFAVQLPELLADAKDRLEESAFAVGSGTLQPFGVITRGTSQNRAGTAAAGPTAQDAYSLQAALPARWRGPDARNVWLMNLLTMNLFRQAPSFTGSVVPLLQDTAEGPIMLGKRVYESTSVLGTYTTGNKVMAYLDGRQYYIVDRVGMSIVYDPVVLGSNHRPTGQGAWYAFWRVGADVSTTNAVRVFATLT